MTNEISKVIDARNRIARLALDGHRNYTHEAIGHVDDDVNGMANEIGLPLVWSARADDDVAVYSDGRRWAIVGDCNGPVVITEVAS
jgi:hypothetical protein